VWGRNSTRQGEPAEPDTAEGERSPFEELSRRLQAALDVIGEGIVICDHDGEVAFRNSAAGRYLTSAPTDALAVQAVSELTREALAGHSPDRQLDLLSPARHSLSIRAFPIMGAEGVEGAVVVVEDITDRLRLESVRRDFVANVTHELKTPTGALALLAETIEGEDDPEVISRLAQRMGSEADRLVRIIDDLLDLSRIEVNETPQKVLVPVEEIIGEAIDSLQDVAGNLEVTVKVGDCRRDLAVPGDRRDLVSAVSNLVDNAIKYSEAGGEVYVELREAGPGIELSVTDRGVGIPGRDLERIFERFYRVDRARSRATGGTGLGLSIVRHVAANHGGSVTVDSKEGEGSTFVLSLPAVTLAAIPEPASGGEGDLA
jgi:two-component system, OmpR family, sensor histidine kinase SenX3